MQLSLPIMVKSDVQHLAVQPGVHAWRLVLARAVESTAAQRWIALFILLNALVLGLDTTAVGRGAYAPLLRAVDQVCLAVFVADWV